LQDRREAGLRSMNLAMSGVSHMRLAATCAILTAMLAVICAAGASASGGVGSPGDGSGGDGDGVQKQCRAQQFGERTLERGDCGSDVATLNWLLRYRAYPVELDKRFASRTHDSVRDYQDRRGLARTGVVNGSTRDALVASMGRQQASWYGPGFFGNTTACGQTLRRGTVGVAHRSLPCGTKVVFGYKGRFVRARVIDRGPFVKQARYERDWDLTAALAEKLRFAGVDTVRTAPIR
jgi:rare lipoprotein A (peptidoglycan hydrolase)